MPWNQSAFESKIAEWIAADDIPFSEVEKPYFRSLLQFVHQAPELRIPSAATIRRRILQMGDLSISDLKQMIAVSHCIGEYQILFKSFPRVWNQRSLYLWMHGHLQMVTHFLLLLCIIYQTNGSKVSLKFI